MFANNKNLYKILYLALCLVIVLGFTYGYIHTIGKIKSNINTLRIESHESIKPEKQNQLISTETRYATGQNIDSETKLTSKFYYTVCGHVITQTSNIPEDIRQITEEQFRLAYQDWNIEKFSSDEIIISKYINEMCPNHYILKEKDGKLAVYYQRPINGVVLKEITNISTESLSKADQSKLKRGIVVDSNEKLAELLEDFGS